MVYYQLMALRDPFKTGDDMTYSEITLRLNKLWPSKEVESRDSWYYSDYLIVREPHVRIHPNIDCDGEKFFEHLDDPLLVDCGRDTGDLLKQIFDLVEL